MKYVSIPAFMAAILTAVPAWSDAIGDAAAFMDGYRKGQARAREARLQQLQLEEAERNAEIQKLEYERRIRELNSVAAASTQSTGPQSLAQLLNDLAARAPFQVDDGVVLQHARMGYEYLTIGLKFQEHRAGLSVSDEEKVRRETPYLDLLACSEPGIHAAILAGVFANFVLFDNDGRYFGTHMASGDCH